MGGDAWVIGSWPSAGAAAPRVKPPANVAPLFRSSRRLKRFEPIGLSFADEPKRKSLSRSREYTPVSGPNRASPEVPASAGSEPGLYGIAGIRKSRTDRDDVVAAPSVLSTCYFYHM